MQAKIPKCRILKELDDEQRTLAAEYAYATIDKHSHDIFMWVLSLARMKAQKMLTTDKLDRSMQDYMGAWSVLNNITDARKKEMSWRESELLMAMQGEDIRDCINDIVELNSHYIQDAEIDELADGVASGWRTIDYAWSQCMHAYDSGWVRDILSGKEPGELWILSDLTIQHKREVPRD